MVASAISYGYVREAGVSFEEALARTEQALQSEGFGVLCRIDIREKLKEKLGVEFSRYAILGACNPPLAYAALRKEINVGLLLPCNAVVYENEGKVFVGVIDAARMLSVVGNAELEQTARMVDTSLRRVVESVVSSGAGA